MDECPVCLEPLSGTVVHLGCCRNRVHIQCYLETCPLCRAALPVPPRPNQVIVPVNVGPTPPSSVQKVVPLVGFVIGIGLIVLVTYVPKVTT